MELETTRLISVSNFKSDLKPSISFGKDVKKLTNLFQLILTSIFYVLIFIFFVIFLYIKSKKFINQYLENRKVIKDLNYYERLQNYFCDYIHNIYDDEIEENIELFNISFINTTYAIFIYKSEDYLSKEIQKDSFIGRNEALNLLTALQKFGNDNNIQNPKEIIMIDNSGHIGWFPIFLGNYKYKILAFEPLPTNYYVFKKNYCRNNRDFFGDQSSIIIINEGLYREEKYCDFYKSIKNKEKDVILCDSSKSNKLSQDFKRIKSVEMGKLSNFIKYINMKNIALIRINLDYEGEEVIKSNKQLFNEMNIPYVFIEFSKKSFEVRETQSKNFLEFFDIWGYRMSLNGFFDNSTVTIDNIIKSKDDHISLYLTYNKQKKN